MLKRKNEIVTSYDNILPKELKEAVDRYLNKEIDKRAKQGYKYVEVFYGINVQPFYELDSELKFGPKILREYNAVRLRPDIEECIRIFNPLFRKYGRGLTLLSLINYIEKEGGYEVHISYNYSIDANRCLIVSWREES